MEVKEKALRYNENKIRYDLVDAFAHQKMVEVLTVGAEKYGDNNWRKGFQWLDVIASMKRHTEAYLQGEDYDQETGKLHMAHVACNAHFLTAFYSIYPEGDNRNHKYLNVKRIGLDIDEVLADFTDKWKDFYGLEWISENWCFDKDMSNKLEELKYNKEFWLSIKPKINPKDLNFEPHCYITSRGVNKEWTEEWLLNNKFPSVPVHTLEFGASKLELCKQLNIEVFVDDKYETFVELNKNGILCYLFDAPHNRRYNVGFKRIYNLNEIL